MITLPAGWAIFLLSEISIVFRLLQQLQFVDLVKNYVDPRSNEFAV